MTEELVLNKVKSLQETGVLTWYEYEVIRSSLEKVADSRFDFQLKEAKKNENALKYALAHKSIELKTEGDKWRDSKNLSVEYKNRGEWSAIAVTKCDIWTTEFKSASGKTLCYLMFPIDVIKRMAQKAINDDSVYANHGRVDYSDLALIPLRELFTEKWLLDSEN